jgi:hypothetical protein
MKEFKYLSSSTGMGVLKKQNGNIKNTQVMGRTYFALATGRGRSSYGVFGDRLRLLSFGAPSLLLVKIMI